MEDSEVEEVETSEMVAMVMVSGTAMVAMATTEEDKSEASVKHSITEGLICRLITLCHFHQPANAVTFINLTI